MNKINSLSIIVPAYNEQDIIVTNVNDIIKEVNSLKIEFSIIIIDDGSSDQTWDRILELTKLYPKLILGLKLSKNYGKDRAILAGLEISSSDLYLTIDADGEHPINKINEFYYQYQNSNCDVIHGIKRIRKGSNSRNFLSRIFNKIFKFFSYIDLTESSDFKLFNEKFKIALLNYGDYDFFFRAAAVDVGFISKHLIFDERKVTLGTSSWSNKKLIKYAFNLIVNYSYVPLFFILFLGFSSIVFSFLIGIKALYDSFIYNIPDGYLTLLMLALLSLGVIMTAIGIIGVYVAKIFDEVKGRPKYLIEKKTNE